MVKTCINFSFESTLGNVKSVLKNIIEYLKDEIPGISNDELLELRLIFSELLINAVIHGNNGDNSKKVELMIEINSSCISSVVKDEGNGFNYIPYTTTKNKVPTDIFSDHGRGLELVTSLTDSIHFNHKGNQIEFRKAIGL